MNNHINTLLNDPQIREIIDSQREGYIFAQLNIEQHSQKDLSKIIRVAFLLINHTLNPNFKIQGDRENTELLAKAYILLRSVDIQDQRVQSTFQSVMGLEEVDPKTLYYFYLSVIGLKNRDNIKVRIDLAGFHPTNRKEILSDWKKRVLNKILEAFILLVRKGTGFRDIQDALDAIMILRKEQKGFEDKYLEQNKEREYDHALSLLALYHTSKAIVETADFLIQGYSYKPNLEIIIRQHSDLAKKLFEQEPRLQSLATYLEYSLQIIRSNSIWERTKGLGDYVRKLCDFKARQQNIIELLPSQTDALGNRLLDAQSSITVLQMPTSAGKTLLAEFYILQTIALQQDAKIVYVVPSRALVNQVYNDLKTDLEQLGLVVEKTSGAIEIDPSESELLETEKIHVLVSTPEKLDLLIRRNHASVENISLIVVDEAHTISNGERGAKLELLMSILKRERPNAKFLLLTPFLGKDGQENMVNWLAGDDANKVKTPIKIDWKPAEKLTIGIGVNKSKKQGNVKFTLRTLPSPYTIIEKENTKIVNLIFDIESKGEKDKVAEFTAKQFAKDNKSILYLCGGKNSADNRAKFLENFCEADDTQDDRRLVQKFIEEEIGRPTLLTSLLDKKIVVHHAGLSDETKLLVEYLIREKQIKYICSTSTIAEGVNFPVSTVFFDSFEKGKTAKMQNIPLSTNDFWNIAGRAGRTLVDNFGTIIFPFTGDKNEPKARQLIENASNELASCLIKFLTDYERIKAAFSDKEAKQEKAILMEKHNESLSPLVQYLIHLLLAGKNYYVSEIQDLFKDSLGYYMLSTDNRQKFLDICQVLYNYLNQQNKATLTFADKTGFSVPSVLEVMRAKKENPLVRDLDSWQPHVLFDKNNSEPLAEKIKVIAALKETKIGTDADGPFNPDLIAKILIGWVKGDKLEDMSLIHPFYHNFPEGERINEFVKDINERRFKASWGLSALEGIVRGNEKDIKDSFVPSYVYFGVDNEKSLLLRMVGIPRTLAFSMASMLGNNVGKMTYADVRKNIKGLSDQDWKGLIPTGSKMDSAEWKRVTEILVR